MGKRDTFEPPYSQTQAEVDAYCARLIAALERELGNRLVCVLLCGSWARGEAKPPTSDTDITVIVDYVDDAMLQRLQQVWIRGEFGNANIYSLADVAAVSHIALEMYTTNAVVLWGTNPFLTP